MATFGAIEFSWIAALAFGDPDLVQKPEEDSHS